MLAMRRFAIRHSRGFARVYGALEILLRAAAPLARALGRQRLEPLFARVERAVKQFLFDCRMCGACTLAATGMSCPMNCPKELRNGPCGGVRPDGTCEVDPKLDCVWIGAWRGAERMGAITLPAEIHAPVEHDRAGTSTWLRVAEGGPRVVYLVPSAAPRATGSGLERALARGDFVVTAEFSPPDSADPADVHAHVELFRGFVDALNVTDASGANCHMSSLGVSALLLQAGCEPVMQISCRDRNRIAIQGDILGAAALGVRNLLCLSGDHVSNGDHPGARHVGDLDAVTLLATARIMRDESRFLSGRKLTTAPRLLLGAADNPCAPLPESRIARLSRKIDAGAQFVQTQYCFDVDGLQRYMALVRAAGLHERVRILIGVGPIPSAKTARWLRSRVPGVHIPDAIVERLERAADPRAEGTRICVELVRQIRDVRGVAGVHVMAPKRDSLVPEIVAESGILGGRQPVFSRATAEAAA